MADLLAMLCRLTMYFLLLCTCVVICSLGYWTPHVRCVLFCLGVVFLFASRIHIVFGSFSHGNNCWRFTVRINVIQFFIKMSMCGFRDLQPMLRRHALLYWYARGNRASTHYLQKTHFCQGWRLLGYATLCVISVAHGLWDLIWGRIFGFFELFAVGKRHASWPSVLGVCLIIICAFVAANKGHCCAWRFLTFRHIMHYYFFVFYRLCRGPLFACSRHVTWFVWWVCRIIITSAVLFAARLVFVVSLQWLWGC